MLSSTLSNTSGIEFHILSSFLFLFLLWFIFQWFGQESIFLRMILGKRVFAKCFSFGSAAANWLHFLFIYYLYTVSVNFIKSATNICCCWTTDNFKKDCNKITFQTGWRYTSLQKGYDIKPHKLSFLIFNFQYLTRLWCLGLRAPGVHWGLRGAIIHSQNTCDISTLETYYLNFIAIQLLYAKVAVVFWECMIASGEW